MSRILRLAGKELRQQLHSATAYLLALIFVVAAAVPLFWADSHTNIFLNGQTDLRVFFATLPWLLMVFVPAIAMRTWAEERRAGTLELLLSYPLRDGDLVLGKFLGNGAVLLGGLLATLPIPLLTAGIGDLDWGPVIGGYVGALFLAAAALAVCQWAGSMTPHQVSAFVIGVIVLAIGMFWPWPDFSFYQRFAHIARGVLDSRDLAFYGLVTAGGLYANTLTLGVRR